MTHGMYLESNVCYRYADAIEICNLYYRPPPLPLLPNNSVLLKLTILLSRGGRRRDTHHLSIISYHQTFLDLRNGCIFGIAPHHVTYTP